MNSLRYNDNIVCKVMFELRKSSTQHFVKDIFRKAFFFRVAGSLFSNNMWDLYFLVFCHFFMFFVVFDDLSCW